MACQACFAGYTSGANVEPVISAGDFDPLVAPRVRAPRLWLGCFQIQCAAQTLFCCPRSTGPCGRTLGCVGCKGCDGPKLSGPWGLGTPDLSTILPRREIADPRQKRWPGQAIISYCAGSPEKTVWKTGFTARLLDFMDNNGIQGHEHNQLRLAWMLVNFIMRKEDFQKMCVPHQPKSFWGALRPSTDRGWRQFAASWPSLEPVFADHRIGSHRPCW
jgi:hypothetical protein